MLTGNVIQDLLKPLAMGRDLSAEQAARAFQIIMNGGATPAQMGAFLMGLAQKGESVEEITAGAQVLRIKGTAIAAPEGTLDTCGTGGDGKHTLNISTGVALVVAACGVPVAKHGNRAVSSSSGSADVLEALGVKVDASPQVAERCLREHGICFMLAPVFHPAMRHVAPIRQELAIRSVFNLLGPLVNPAQPKRQMVGVFSEQWIRPMAEVLKALGVTHAWVVHGRDGMDELTLSGPSLVAELKDGDIREFMVTPEEAGLLPATAEQLAGGNARHNAEKLRGMLMGEKGVYRDAVLLNAAAALIIAGKATHLKEGVQLAAEAIDSGQAYKTLQTLVSGSHERA